MSAPKRKTRKKKSAEENGVPSLEELLQKAPLEHVLYGVPMRMGDGDGEEWSYLDGPLPADFGSKSMPPNRRKQKPSK